jgi:release factor glutamine methyltransferase
MTVGDCARDAAQRLVRAGMPAEDSRRDVAILARSILGWDQAAWLTRQNHPAPAGFFTPLDALARRRAAGEPVAYLMGEREFYGRTFAVTPAVLIPRPETELLVDRALARIDERHTDTFRVLDCGTGSGCIAVTLAAERSHLVITGTDVSQNALHMAKGNASRHGVTDRVSFEQVSLCGEARDVALVVSNPPYVPERDRASLMRDVRDFEPALALFGGEDGLDVIRLLIPAALAALEKDGALIMEIGAGQAGAVERLLVEAGFTDVTLHRDLAGIDRIVEATRKSV